MTCRTLKIMKPQSHPETTSRTKLIRMSESGKNTIIGMPTIYSLALENAILDDSMLLIYNPILRKAKSC